jgi:hypothetical protein
LASELESGGIGNTVDLTIIRQGRSLSVQVRVMDMS